jgi:hypothetical protein
LFTSVKTRSMTSDISSRSASGHRSGAPSRWCAVHSVEKSSVICLKSLVTTALVGTSTIAGTVMPRLYSGSRARKASCSRS